MKPNLTYCHNSLLPLKNFLYFPEKNPGALFNPKPKTQKTFTLKTFLIFWEDADQA